MSPYFFIMKLKYYYKLSLVIFLGIVPVVLLILPKDFFDHGPTLCISKLFMKQDCYACGLSRGIMHLIHLDFENAFAYNMLSFIVFPLLGFIWVQWFLKELRIVKALKKQLDPNTVATGK